MSLSLRHPGESRDPSPVVRDDGNWYRGPQ